MFFETEQTKTPINCNDVAPYFGRQELWKGVYFGNKPNRIQNEIPIGL